MKKNYFLLLVCAFVVNIYTYKTQAQVPQGANHPIQQIFFANPPATNLYITGWMHAATLFANGATNNGYVIVEYIKVIEKTGGGATNTLFLKQFTGSGPLSTTEGGLFNRIPTWYDSPTTYLPLSNSNQSNGKVTINVGNEPNKISHWWVPRTLGNASSTYYLEVRMLISGDIGVQIGCDYWKDPTTQNANDDVLGWVSNWFEDSNNQYITVTVPANGMFDRNDYGFCSTNGCFFISKAMVDFLGGTEVALRSNETGWADEGMTLIGDYYQSNNHGSFSPSQYKYYCFGINYSTTPAFVPYSVINNLMYSSDAVSNGMGGYNFYTLPNPTHQICTGMTSKNDISISKEILIYPNPATDNIMIENLTSKDNLILLYNIQGQEILRQEINNTNGYINIKDIPDNIYIMKIINNQNTIIKKIIKKGLYTKI